MPGSRRSPQVSSRDLEVLRFIGRFGVVSRDAVALWADTGRTVTYVRERRLRDAGLVEVRPGFGFGGRVLLSTVVGLKLVGLGGLARPRFSLGRLRHDLVVSLVAAELERSGVVVLSEREFSARERDSGDRCFSAELAGRRFHRADLMGMTADGGPPEAVEVELAVKGRSRLDALLRAWRRAVVEGRVSRVVYRCTPEVFPLLQAAVSRTRTSAVVFVECL